MHATVYTAESVWTANTVTSPEMPSTFRPE